MVLESIRSTIPCSLSKNVDTRPVETTKITSTTTALKKLYMEWNPLELSKKKSLQSNSGKANFEISNGK